MANTFYRFRTTNVIRDLDGEAPAFASQLRFTTGDSADNMNPMVLSVAPPDGAAEVGVNAGIRVRFNEPINPLTVTATTILVTDGISPSIACTISFSNSNQDVLLVPHAPLTDATLHALTVNGVEDLAGNAVLAQTTEFTTRVGPDTEAPVVVRTNPFSSATDVPVNSVVTLEVNEPTDPGSVNSSSFLVQDNTTSQAVPGIFTVSADGRVVDFVPDALLGVGRSHSVFF